MTRTSSASPESTGQPPPRDPTGWKRTVRWTVVIATVAVCGVAGAVLTRFDASSQADSKQAVRPIPVRVRALGDMQRPVRMLPFRGDVAARRRSELAFRRSGPLAQVLVNVGDSAAAGQLLASLDTADLRAEAQRLDAEADAFAAALAEAQAGPRRQEKDAAKAAVDQIAARLKAAQRRESRLEKLFRQDAAAEQTVENEQLLVEELGASLREATQRYDQLVEGTRAEQIQAARARLQSAQAARQAIAVSLSDSEIRAPYDCFVASRLADEGAVAGPGGPVLVVLERPPLEATFGLPPGIADVLPPGTAVPVTVGATDQTSPPRQADPVIAPGRFVGDAQVVRRGAEVDPVTRTRDIVVRFPAVDVSLAGRTATAWINADRLADQHASRRPGPDDTYWVPTRCLVRGVRGLWGVYAVAEPSAENISGEGSTSASGPNTTPENPNTAPENPNTAGGDSGTGNSFSVVRLHDAEVIDTVGDQSLVQIGLADSNQIIVDGTHLVGPGVKILPVTDGKQLTTDLSMREKR